MLTHCYGEQFGYDAWGNLLSISSVSSAYTGCTQENLSVGVNGNNQIVGYGYDAAGNLISTPAPAAATYTYNAENQLTATGGVTYTYDGDGKRVMKSTGKTYWYGMGSDVLYENDGAGHWYNYFYFDGRRISRRDELNNVGHFGLDHLGNARFVFAGPGIGDDVSNFYPFGGERVVSTGTGNRFKFTGKERDPESGLDDFLARYDSSALGRFLSADPGGILVADAANPQSWNQYSYVQNNPTNMTDPSGLFPWSIFGGFGGGRGFGGWGGFGGGIWNERPPLPDWSVLDNWTSIFLGRPNPNVFISDYHLDAKGSVIGDYRGEQLCVTHGLPNCSLSYWNPDTDSWENDVPLPPGVADMLGHAGKMADAGTKAAMVVTAPNYVAMGGIIAWDLAPAWFTDAFNGINNNPLFRYGRGYNEQGKQISRWASGGRWGKGGPKLPWHWHIP